MTIKSKATVAFKNADDEVIYKKLFPLAATLADLAKVNSEMMRDPETFWVFIEVEEIDLLDSLSLIALDHDTIRLDYNFEIDEIFQLLTNDEDNFDEIVEKIQSEIWARDKEIMERFGSDELYVEWGGPVDEKKPKEEPELSVSYYIAEDFTWLYFTHKIRPNEKCESVTLESILSNTLHLSSITRAILNSVK
jgi:hypothetical protein